MGRKNISIALTILILVGLIGYLTLVNFRLPIMTADEMRYLVASVGEVMYVAVKGGRYSGLLMIPLAEALSFSTPNILQLIPRFASMLLLTLAIFLLIRKLGFSSLASLALAAFILTAHELDWQHNGLVAFFGIYNVLFAAFIFALLTNEQKNSNRWSFALTTILLIVSYASELFIGLALCYFILKAITSRPVNQLARSPFLWSLVIYGTAFLIIKATTSLRPSTAEGISTYLVGSVGIYGTTEMLSAALLYFINSLPYFNLLKLPPSTSIVLSAIVLIVVITYVLLLLLNTRRGKKSSHTADVYKMEGLLVTMLALLAVAPNFLMALQPLKVDWILRNASVHYVFSYYTWIGLAIMCIYAARQAIGLLGSGRAIRVLFLMLIPTMFAAAAFSANQNLMLVLAYKSSREKWLQLNELLTQSSSKVVEVSTSYLQHPFISAVESVQLKAFAKKFYGVELHICRTDREITLTEAINSQLVELEGFSSAEPIGRWTDGAIASLTLLEVDPNINFIELEIASVFHTNHNAEVVITKGETEYRYRLDGVGKYRYDLPGFPSGPLRIRLLIDESMSPLKLGTGSDARNLGVLVKEVRLGQRNALMLETPHTMKSCY